MIEKMKFLSITGPKEDIDRVIDQYLSKYEIQLENALSELKTVKDLRPYIEINPYKEICQTAVSLTAGCSKEQLDAVTKKISLEEAIDVVTRVSRNVTELTEKKETLQKQINELSESLDKVVPYANLNYDLRSILHFRYIKFRFGRIPRDYFDKFQSYVYDDIDTVIHKCMEDREYVWIVYFVPDTISEKVDAIYASMHFERFFLPDEYEGTPQDAVKTLREKIAGLKQESDGLDRRLSEAVSSDQDTLIAARNRLTAYTTNFDVRKLAACTKDEHHTFYILCGWMSERDAKAFQKELTQDENTFCIVEDDHSNILSSPPTKLRNPGLFKPFEMYIRMYGLPSYHEIDPTILVGLTYSFLFGFMFGDVGQGLCLLLGGFLLYRMKKMSLAAIISCCGFFSTIFGFMFGSVFGFEDIIEHPLWLRPAEAMTDLPFIGRLNTVFVVAIALGMVIIMVTMVLNIINSLRVHDVEKTWFDTNGVAGLVFYASIAATLVLFMTGNSLPGTIVLIVMFGLPLLIMFFKEPLTAKLEKKAEETSSGAVMFVVQGFFELFEVLLSYFSNTLSFVRVGAFAVSHAAMMEVVLMLAGAEAGDPNWVVVVLGNLFVCGMEGLIVGIQVLRLEYYELFSRFYRGTGREFKPYGRA